jgi:hypothetical protein
MMRRAAQSWRSKDQLVFSWMEKDPSTLPNMAKAFLGRIRTDKEVNTHFLISCGKHKQHSPSPAAQLYTSPRFRLSVMLPPRLHLPFSVLSAEHGLLHPETLVEPYDVSLSSKSREERRHWAERVFTQLATTYPHVQSYVLLTDDDYRDELVPLLLGKNFSVVEPLLGLERSGRISFLRQCHRLLDRETAIHAVYKLLESLGGEVGLPTLAATLRGGLPNQGVYFFFDPDEPTQFSTKLPRLVRIGTHGVSAGSKATLRDRLRTHFGTATGYGNICCIGKEPSESRLVCLFASKSIR